MDKDEGYERHCKELASVTAQRDELEKLCNYHEKIHADLLEQLAEAPRWRDWQTLEAAPLDGTVVLLIGRGKRHADGYWEQGAYSGNGAWIWPYVHCNPTHWMPLPPPPKVGDGDTVTLRHNNQVQAAPCLQGVAPATPGSAD